MDITISDVTASAGVAFPAPPPRPAPADPARATARSAVRKVAEVAESEPTPALPVAAERAALAHAAPRREPEEASHAYALTLTDALWQLTKSFRQTV